MYINAHTHAYISEICYVYILNICIYNIYYMNININANVNVNVNTCKYFQNIYCMCVYLYIHNKHIQNTQAYANKKCYFGCD